MVERRPEKPAPETEEGAEGMVEMGEGTMSMSSSSERGACDVDVSVWCDEMREVDVDKWSGVI